MKTNYNTQSNINVLSLDDIIFEGRNHAYGAFYLRKHYNQFLIASFIVTASLAVGIFVASLVNKSTVIVEPLPPERLISDYVYVDQSTPPPPPPFDLKIDNSLIRSLTAGPPVIVDNVPITDDPPMITDDLGKMGDSDGKLTTGGIPAFFTMGTGTGTGAIPDDKDTIFPILKEPATFKGADFRKWVVENLHYVGESAAMEIQGKVIIQFVVNKVGNVEDAKILRGLDPVLDKEAVRVVSTSKWFPGKQNGHPAKQLFTIPINFKLENRN
jgi:periplasmic protein TonB